MTFFAENKLFIMGVILLAALIAGAASLQGARDARSAAQVPLAQAPAGQASGQESNGTEAVSVSAGVPTGAPAAEIPAAPARADVSVSQGTDMTGAPRPAVQGVSDDDEEDDD